MSRRVHLLSLPVVAFLFVTFSAGVPARGQGKGGSGDDAKVVLPVGGADKLQNDVKTKHYRDTITGLIKGTIQPSEANKDVIDTAAKHYVYRVTWPWLHQEPGRLEEVYKEFDRDLIQALSV